MAVQVEPPHGHHPTGHRRLDIIVPLAALFVSFVSILIAWYSASVEAEMARQNGRMVEASSLPYVQLYSSSGADHFQLQAANSGIGPAEIHSVMVLVDGQPVRNLEELLKACCGVVQRGSVGRSTLTGLMIGAGQTLDYVSAGPSSPAAVRGLNQKFSDRRLETRVCYCSVFEECWVRSSFDARQGIRPRPVKSCPMGPYQYRD
jgi:hypothetical protein